MEFQSKISFIKYLLDEVEAEAKKINEQKENIEAARERASLQGNSYINYLKFDLPFGSRQKTKEYLKTIRRITLDIEKKLY